MEGEAYCTVTGPSQLQASFVYYVHLSSVLICLLRPPFFCSHWPLPVTVVPQGTRVIPSTDTGADTQQLSVVRRWLLRWAKICFYTTFFRLSPKRKDSLKRPTDSSWKPRGISSGPQRCTSLVWERLREAGQKEEFLAPNKAWGRIEPWLLQEEGTEVHRDSRKLVG